MNKDAMGLPSELIHLDKQTHKTSFLSIEQEDKTQVFNVQTRNITETYAYDI